MMIPLIEMTDRQDAGSQPVVAAVLGLFDIHVFVRVMVFGSEEAKIVRVAVMLVAVQWPEQQVKTDVEQTQVGGVAEARERRPVPPQRQGTTITVNAAIVPISTPTLKLRMRHGLESGSSPRVSCCN
ncbi:MAG: hypothetical protein K2W33_15265, partial [Burkholderiales bacterium]|nr:hypothetical protein [Burkholderiales bacterium]